MTIIDVALLILYLFLVIVLAVLYFRSHPEFEPYEKFYKYGLAVKLIGGISFALIYTFYYSYGGDTMAYFKDSWKLNELLFQSFHDWKELLFGDCANFQFKGRNVLHGLIFRPCTTEFFVTSFTSFITLFGLGSYFSTTLLFALLSFIGVWHFFMVFVQRYPRIKNQLAFAILFMPSVFFWGSGLMKDSITIGFIGMMIYYLDNIKKRRGRLAINIIFFILSGVIIFKVKSYIIMSLVPALLIWFFLDYKDRIRSVILRNLSVPLFLVLSFYFISIAVNKLGEYNQKYSIEEVLDTARGMQSWHYVEGQNSSDQYGRGSSYSLGDYEPTIAGVRKMFFPAINVTLFRPYLTEVKNVLMVFSALESLAIFLFTIYVFIGLGLFRVVRFLISDSFLLMSFVFALFFAFAVGFTSYNFGALVRYKIPCIPFYMASLFILQYKVKEQREKQNRRRTDLRAKQRRRKSRRDVE